MELKVLGMVDCLVGFDDLEELIGISVSSMQDFVHSFSKHCRDDLYPLHVKMPSTLEELTEVEASYAALVIPGACGSMEVVHIPFGIINLCTGKEGYPTLGYNVICDHTGRTLAVMPGPFRTIN